MEDLGLTSDKVTKQDPETRLFRRRWIIIFAFALYLSTNAYQWLHIIIISDVILIYYNASLPENEFSRNSTVDWLSLVYMLTFVVLIIPSMWLLERKGLRFIALSGSFCNAAGAMIKVASVSEERFGVLMFGQTVCGIAQALTLSLPTKIAAVWFGQNEVSTATAIGVFGTQIGHALGFVVPPVLVPASINHSDIGTNLRIMFYIGAGVTTFCFILLIVVFKKEPSVPPSKAQIASKVIGKQRTNYLKSLVNIGKIRDFYLLCLAFAINLGCSYAISTLLNPMILYYFERNHHWNIPDNCCWNGCLLVHVKDALTLGCVFMCWIFRIVGIVMTVGMRAIMSKFGIFAANLSICAALVIATVLSAFVSRNYKRQKANKEMLSHIEETIEVEQRINITEC